MIGDRKHDLIGARRNDLDAAAVGYGFGSATELQAEAPRYHFHSLTELHRAFLGSGRPNHIAGNQVADQAGVLAPAQGAAQHLVQLPRKVLLDP